MAFKQVMTLSNNSQPFQYLIGTNTEVFALGEVLTLASGKLTKAGLDSDGTQKYICMKSITGDGASNSVPVVEIRADVKYKCESEAATSVVGDAYTLDTAAQGITAVTIKGVFIVDVVDEYDVVGHFA